MTTAFKPLTKDDIAEVLGVSLRTIENWVSDGTLPSPRKLGNRVFWHPTIFYAWLECVLTTEDATELTGTQPTSYATDTHLARKPKARAKPAGTELEKLRARENAKLEHMLS
jgi:excisionase family DNA binding protein